MTALVFDKVTRSPVEVDGLTIDGVRLVISHNDAAGSGFLITEVCGDNSATLAIPDDAVIAMADLLKKEA